MDWLRVGQILTAVIFASMSLGSFVLPVFLPNVPFIIAFGLGSISALFSWMTFVMPTR